MRQTQANQPSIEEASLLGKKTEQDHSYNPKRLYPIPRANKRNALGINPKKIPFYGFDAWTLYELSCLNEKGKPLVALGEIYYDCHSPSIIESKSLKLYLQSLNDCRFKGFDQLKQVIQSDLKQVLETQVTLMIHELTHSKIHPIQNRFEGESLDELDIECTHYTVRPDYLNTGKESVQETLCSDLLKSNCLVTNQPDWGSIQIHYTGNKINREGLLQYLISFRHHNEFHEQCTERIFMDLMTYCQPKELSVYGRYTRRGGIDINPYRSTQQIHIERLPYRLIRQ